MSGFFQALVVGGAAISAAACGGQSASAVHDSGGASGSGAAGGPGMAGGPTLVGGGSSTGGSGGNQGGRGSGGVSAAGMGGLGAQAGVTVIELGGAGGVGGAAGDGAGAGPLPEPNATAQWDCADVATGSVCVDALGTTAVKLPSDCPVDATRPKSAADCAESQLFSCYLAVTAAGDTTLVNCECYDGPSCRPCRSLVNYRSGSPIECDDTHAVCACAYTGILIAK